MKKENEIDQLFKKGMEDPDLPFNELDWNNMARKLDATESRRRYPLWLYAAVGTAAMLLVALFVLLTPKATRVNQQDPSLVTNTSPRIEHQTTPNVTTPQTEDRTTLITRKLYDKGPGMSDHALSSTNSARPVPESKQTMLADVPSTELPLTLANQHLIVRNPIPVEAKLRRTEPPRLSSKTPGKLTLSVIAAPDITDTKASINRKVSSNFGFLLHYPISKKLSLSTGAIYAKKVYDYGGTTAAGYGEAAAAWKLDADCFVLDVPLNLTYQVAQKQNYTFSVNTGLSSYIMLKEKYRINTDPQASNSIINVNINNQNRHFFGVANFSVTVDRKISDRVSVGIQPFVKVPLTGIGYYNYDLRSKGVAVSLSLKPF